MPYIPTCGKHVVAVFKSFRVGSVLGIPLRFDITFLLIIPLFAYLIGSEISVLVELLEPLLPTGFERGLLTDGVTNWLLGLGAALGLFVSVGLHELGHSVVAMRYGYHIDSITLWLFGGIANLAETPRTWYHEFIIAVAGPLVSIGLGVAAMVPLLVIEGPAAIVFLLAYLGVMNIALAGFNLLPAFPMDGGRVLRALLTRNRSLPRATKLAAETGKGVAVLLGLWGLFIFNIVLMGIAVFIYMAATSEAKRVMMDAALGGVTVEEAMTSLENLRMVTPETSVAELLNRMFHERHTAYPVMRNDRPIGIVTLDDAQSVPEYEREAMEVRDVMSDERRSIHPNTTAMDAIRRMQGTGDDQLLVIDEDGDLAGVLTRADLMRVFNTVRTTGEWDAATHRPEAQRDRL